ncbi:MAG: hypothetical protein AAGB18_06245 [Pseudomonadota bacterium]
MKAALATLFVTAAGLIALSYIDSYQAAYDLAYGAIVAMALSISLTFFWLWRARATPLALGMGFGWAGASGVMGWWWVYSLLSRPEAMVESRLLFVFVSCYFVGGLLHFKVIVRSLGWRAVAVLFPLVAVVLGSLIT